MSMWKYEIRNLHSGEIRVVQGVTLPNACNLNRLNPSDWDVISQTAVDDENALTYRTSAHEHETV